MCPFNVCILLNFSEGTPDVHPEDDAKTHLSKSIETNKKNSKICCYILLVFVPILIIERLIELKQTGFFNNKNIIYNKKKVSLKLNDYSSKKSINHN